MGESLLCQGQQLLHPQLWPGDSDESGCLGDPSAVPETCPMAHSSSLVLPCFSLDRLNYCWSQGWHLKCRWLNGTPVPRKSLLFLSV